MDIIPNLLNAAVMAVVGIAITYLTRTQIRDLRTELKGEISQLRFELKDDIAQLRSELKDENAGLRQDVRDLRGETVSIRGDLTQLALALGVRPRPQTG